MGCNCFNSRSFLLPKTLVKSLFIIGPFLLLGGSNWKIGFSGTGLDDTQHPNPVRHAPYGPGNLIYISGLCCKEKVNQSPLALIK
jgi:hypothetical protein